MHFAHPSAETIRSHWIGLINYFFSSSYVLRQRDPLSPLLFVIVIEMLGRRISVAVSGSFFPAFLWGHELISPILFLLMMPYFSVGLT
jgi:hypothetical protein